MRSKVDRQFLVLGKEMRFVLSKGDRENVAGAGENTNKVACIKVILS